jgi:trans-aconitate methyltransferase
MPLAPSAEYVTDVAYLRNFVEDLAPARLRLVAALNGFSPPPARVFSYCELGSGNGDTVSTLAAANPDGSFFGVDVNPNHIAFATGLARRGGLDNVTFLENDFADLVDGDLPRFHYVGAHGVLSWVSPAKRKALIDFASARLEPGGLLAVSYNALPGWAAIEPLRRLLLDTASGVAGTTLERAQHGLAAAKVLADRGAEYFTQNPAARSMLDAALKGGLQYVAHEYFHSNFCPMYFTDVAREMAAADLYYVGQSPLYLNYPDLAIPPSLLDVYKSITDRVVLERMKDFAVNEFFRRDVYVKGRAACSASTTRAYLESTAFGAPAGRVQRDVKLPHYTLQFVGDIFDALVPALAASASTVAELSARPELVRFGAAKIREAVLRLALADQVFPMIRSTEPVAIADPAARRYRVLHPYNRMMLEQRLSARNLVVLASPLTGSGLTLSLLHAACLHIASAVDPPDRAAWIRSFVAEQPVTLYDDDRAITDREQQAQVLGAQFEELSARRIPELIRLGILEEEVPASRTLE